MVSRTRNMVGHVLLLAGLATAGQARHVVHTARHTYYVDVRNESFRDVWDAQVSVHESGESSASVRVRAAGYRDGSQYVSLSPNQRTVHVTVRLQDPIVRVHLTDRSSRTIRDAWVDLNQFGSMGDEYMVRIQMPREGFETFQPRDVRVDFVFGAQVMVTGSGQNRRVEIRIPRRQLGWSGFVTLGIRIPSDEELAPPPPPLQARDIVRIANFELIHAELD